MNPNRAVSTIDRHQRDGATVISKRAVVIVGPDESRFFSTGFVMIEQSNRNEALSVLSSYLLSSSSSIVIPLLAEDKRKAGILVRTRTLNSVRYCRSFPLE